ncbi:MAG: SDR family oxidoreductase [Verrucomicrobia bacterium]|nr:MAG: SDR family oxidoreductase [Verrucomicrobiota bacterium]
METTKRCWVTGAAGLIGHAAAHAVPLPPGWAAVPLARGDLELADGPAVAARFRADRPDAILHCAAMSRSPDCQRDPVLARSWNVEATRRLAGLAADIPFALLSTDLVFDGKKGNYREDDAVGPLSVYAETKVEAEAAVRQNPRHLVVRTSLNHGHSPTGNRGFNEEILAAWRAGRSLRLFADEFRNPIAAVVTARAVWELLARGASGIVHVAGTEKLSRWEIGMALAARHPEGRGLVEAGRLSEYQGAPRAPDTTLDCTRARAWLGFPLPGYREWLAGNP